MSSVWIYCYFICACYCTVVKAFPMKEDSTVFKGETKPIKMTLKNEFQSTTLGNINEKHITDAPENGTQIRVKRQNSGAGKFVEAAKMPQIKLIRLMLQMFKNSWDASYVGGTHPLHPNVPKIVVALYKQKVVEFFIPDVGNDPDSQ